MNHSNLGNSIGQSRTGRARRGHYQPRAREGKPLTLGGTSAAAPFVTGAIALLWSEFPAASAAEVKFARDPGVRCPRRTTVVPPLLDAVSSGQLPGNCTYEEVTCRARRRNKGRPS